MTNWTDTNGERFRGEPAAILGPLAIFKVGKDASRRVLLSLLSPEDCVRFYTELHEQPARTDNWANASGLITREIYGAVRRLDGNRLVIADLNGVPEPEYVILFTAIFDRRRTWDIMSHAIDEYKVIRHQFADKVEAFFYGNRMGDLAYLELATETGIPWLIRDEADRNRMQYIHEMLPRNAPALTVVTRTGVPILGTKIDSEDEVNKAMASFLQLLALDRPGAIGSMKDREYFYRAVQPVVFADGSADPIIVADPLNPDVLRQSGVTGFSASLEVATDVTVTNVEMAADNPLTDESAEQLSRALTRARFVPAVENGNWVAGTFEYQFK